MRDAEHGTIAVNSARGNCVGILFLADAPGPDGAFSVAANDIGHNTKACPESEDGPPASGVGVLVLGAHDVKIRGNRITDNTPTGPSLVSGGVVVATGMGGTAPLDNVVKGNVVLRNGTDILWDGPGRATCSSPTVCGQRAEWALPRGQQPLTSARCEPDGPGRRRPGPPRRRASMGLTWPESARPLGHDSPGHDHVRGAATLCSRG